MTLQFQAACGPLASLCLAPGRELPDLKALGRLTYSSPEHTPLPMFEGDVSCPLFLRLCKRESLS